MGTFSPQPVTGTRAKLQLVKTSSSAASAYKPTGDRLEDKFPTSFESKPESALSLPNLPPPLPDPLPFDLISELSENFSDYFLGSNPSDESNTRWLSLYGVPPDILLSLKKLKAQTMVSTSYHRKVEPGLNTVLHCAIVNGLNYLETIPQIDHLYRIRQIFYLSEREDTVHDKFIDAMFDSRMQLDFESSGRRINLPVSVTTHERISGIESITFVSQSTVTNLAIMAALQSQIFGIPPRHRDNMRYKLEEFAEMVGRKTAMMEAAILAPSYSRRA